MARVLSIVEGVFGRACLLDKDRRVGAHAHAEPHVVLKIAGADFAYDVGDVAVPCTRDTVVLVNALELHSNRSIGRERSEILSLYLSPQWLIEQHPSLLAAGRLFDKPEGCMTPRLRELADRLAAEMLQGGVVKPERLQFLVAELVLSILEQCGPSLEQAMRMGKLNDFRIRRALALMRENVGEALDIGNVAGRVGLSRSRFFDLFTACTGLSPKQYLDMLRMELAIGSLARTRQPIAEIAGRCGYSAQSHFTRFFVQQIGVTPGEYRRAAGGRPQAPGP
jgi:AraC-like DNA-binding protein